MVNPFQFARLPKIYFKNGILSELPIIVQQFGKNLILVTGGNSFIDSVHAEKLLSDLKKDDVNYFVCSVRGEPAPDTIDQIVQRFNKENINLVVAIGGGSVIDTGKAISAMMYKTDSVSDFLEGIGTRVHPGTKLPFIAVPTTAGTGSEATKNAVLSQVGPNGFKRSLRHDNFVPDIALVDPLLTLNCPPEITAASGMDCFTQLTEAFLSTNSGEYTDALALEGLKEVSKSLKRSYKNSCDVEARSGMSFAALTSGICLANAGLGAVHGFASSIGGMYDIPHGLICASFIASVNEINVKELRKKSMNSAALRKYAILGRLFPGNTSGSEDFYIDGFIDYLHKLEAEMNLKALRTFGLRRDDIELICSKTDIKNNPVELGSENLIEIATSVIK
jgi:alcohol dehydrogenase class IV